MRIQAHQVAVITGAASGIGLGLAHAFAERGLDVVMIDIEAQALDAAAESVTSHGGRVLASMVDVRELAAMEAVAERALDAFGRLDIVCNNAGVNTSPGPIWELDESDWRWILDVNLWGVINGVRAFVPYLVARGSGHVVNTASMAALHPVAGLAPYAVSKHAVVALTECLRADLDRSAPKVGATVLCPLWVWSRVRDAERNRPAELRGGAVQTRPPRPAQSPAEGVFQTPEEVAAAVIGAIESNQLYLLTHDSGREDARAQQLRMLAVIDDVVEEAR
jgi:NAD(P)-dependent dehydrogenase (short-subunit alcohol dehydrogenase family)